MKQEIIHPFGGKTQVFTTEFAGRELKITTGQMAFLADGSVTVQYGETVVLGTATVSNQPRPGIDFFPLMIDYEERMYASGKISGSRFIKREGRSSELATLTCRLIDRPIRPLFPKGYRHDVQGVATVLSVDLVHSPDIVGMIAISTALMLSGAPFDGPVAGVRIGQIDGELIAYPTAEQMKTSTLDLSSLATIRTLAINQDSAAYFMVYNFAKCYFNISTLVVILKLSQSLFLEIFDRIMTLVLIVVLYSLTELVFQKAVNCLNQVDINLEKLECFFFCA